MATMKGTCTPDQFWTCVAEIGWQDKNPKHFYRSVEQRLLQEWDNEFLASFREHLDRFRGALSQKVTQFERLEDVSCECGSDGFFDLLHHVIGLGKEEYEASMEDPMRVVRRGQEQRFEESFSYCIPWAPKLVQKTLTFKQALKKAQEEIGEDGDALLTQLEHLTGGKAKLDPRYYSLWAKQELEDLKVLWHSEFAGEFAPDLTDLIGILGRVAKGDAAAVFEHPELKDRVRALREKREAVFRRETLKLEVLRGRGWGLDNMISDMHQYLEGKAL